MPAAPRAATLVFAVALLVRLLYLWSLPAHPYFHEPHSDHRLYLGWAYTLAAGNPVPADISIQQPAYAYLLAPLASWTPDPAAVARLAHLLAGCLTAALLTLLAARALPLRAALAAGLLYATAQPVVFADLTWSKEQLSVACCLAVFLLWPARGWRGLAELCLAMLAVGLRELFLVPVLLAAATALPRRQLFAAVALACLLLWGWSTLHTAVRDGAPPQGFAQPLYVGVWPGAGIIYTTPPFVRPGRIYEAHDWRAETERRLGAGVSAATENRYWLQQALAEAARNPWRFARLIALRAAAGLWGGPLEDNYPYVLYAQRSLLRWLVPHWLLVTLGLGGLLLWWASGERSPARALCTAVVLGALLAPAPFYMLERLRLPLWPALAVAAVAGLLSAARLPRRWLLLYALAAFITLNPWLTARLAPFVAQGTRTALQVIARY